MADWGQGGQARGVWGHKQLSLCVGRAVPVCLSLGIPGAEGPGLG